MLGYRVGRVTIPIGDDPIQLDGRAFDVVYVAAPNPLSGAESLTPIGELRTLSCRPRPAPPVPLDVTLVDGSSARLATTIEFGGRYCRDPRLGDEAAMRVYQQWLSEAASDSTRQLVAPVEGGAVLVLRVRPELRIELLGVQPAVRRTGLARRLVKYALEFAANAGAVIYVGCYGDNSAAVALYESMGFRIVHRWWWYHWWPETTRRLELAGSISC